MGESFGGSVFEHAFLWDEGSMIDLGTLPTDSTFGTFSRANAVNGVSSSATGVDRGVLWARGTVTELGAPVAGGATSAFAINNRGQIAQRVTATSVGHAVIWTKQ